jgi:hypothetical protein
MDRDEAALLRRARLIGEEWYGERRAGRKNRLNGRPIRKT